VTVGETTVVEPVKAPGFQVYVEAPPAVKVALLPLQINVGEEDAVTVGLGFTVKEIVLVFEQEPVLPVTV
jgi:hypothetical protein